MKIIQGLNTAKTALKRRPLAFEAPPKMKQRIKEIFGAELTPDQAVSRIIMDVAARGDSSLIEYTKKIDGIDISQLEVTADEMASARSKVNKELVSALSFAADRVRSYHEAQKQRLGTGFVQGGLGVMVRPIERVGAYVPGGKASYPSTVLMTAIPAQVAGVSEVIVATPPAPDGSVPAPVLVAAGLAGVSRVFKIGGAQAVAALAYGTESVPKVDKICGPGNIFVTLAKRQVYGVVGIDGLYGPTETVIIADESADPVLCAADMMAQAEHDEAASAILITTSLKKAEQVAGEIKRQVVDLERRSIILQSLDRNGCIAIVANVNEAIDLANYYAPEHLCLMVADAAFYLARIRNAGGVFIGAPEAAGDYTAGPSHVMPTEGSARYSSPLSILDFIKVISLVNLDAESVKKLGPATSVIARAEGLTAHARAAELRMEGHGDSDAS